jgi:acetyl esterase
VPVDYQALRERRLASLPAETRSIYEAQKDGLSLRRLGIERFRTLFAELMSAGRPANDVTTKVETRVVEVPTSTGIVATKIYIPHGQREPVGVYVHMHGGGWIAGGGFEAWDSINAELAVAWGCAIAHPDFRLAPESKFPGPSMDCYAAAEWIGRHGDKLGLDSRRIAVGGGCTGANLAAVVALMARDAGTPRLAGQCLFAPRWTVVRTIARTLSSVWATGFRKTMTSTQSSSTLTSLRTAGTGMPRQSWLNQCVVLRQPSSRSASMRFCGTARGCMRIA